MNFALNVLFQFILAIKKVNFKLKSMILTALIIYTINLILLPFIVYFIPGLFGFILTSIIMLSFGIFLFFNKNLGFANAIGQSSTFALGSFVPLKYLIAISTGNGLAGILMNVIKYIILFIFGVDRNDREIKVIQAFVFFGFAALFSLVSIYFLMVNLTVLKSILGSL